MPLHSNQVSRKEFYNQFPSLAPPDYDFGNKTISKEEEEAALDAAIAKDEEAKKAAETSTQDARTQKGSVDRELEDEEMDLL
jgi:hypothetical protein